LRRLVVGARGSKLSTAQTTTVTSLLSQHFPNVVMDVVSVKTLGDRLPPGKRGSVDGKTAFTGDIESKLISGELDIAVHSMKDLPGEMDERLVIAATPARGDPRDALVSNGGSTMSQLPRGAKVGTSSLRRKAQLLRMRDDLQVVDLHGNLETRLRKLTEGIDAVVLSAAGLERIGASNMITQYFTTGEMVPAVCQAILAVQSRRDDEEVASMLSRIEDRKTRVEATCERAFLVRLGGDCTVPLAANAELAGESLSVVGLVASEDGRETIKKVTNGKPAEAEALGKGLADEVLRAGGDRILASVRRST
jgi:hydroxymethylbilane synthase